MRVRAPVTLLLLLVAAVVPASAAPGSAPAVGDNASSSLDRAAFVALPAVYQLRIDIRVDVLVADGRRFPFHRDVQFYGTAFGVAPGRVIAARHVVVPPEHRLVEGAVNTFAPTGLPRDQSRIRAVGRTVRRISLMRARTELAAVEAGPGLPKPITARVRRMSDSVGDLVLLGIDDPDAPFLPLLDSLTIGTPVTVIGFGPSRPMSAIPAVRPGTLVGFAETRETKDDRFGVVAADIQLGDSGAPVLDAQGRARGVVLRRQVSVTPPVIGRTQTVLDLLGDDRGYGFTQGATAEFAEAMGAFWRRDYPAAASRLANLRNRYPDAALVTFEHRRASALAVADYAVSGPSRKRGAILALGAMATLAAATFGVLRILRQA